MANSRTWLLSGLCFLVSMIWMATLFGLGSHINDSKRPAEPLALPVLPLLPVSHAEDVENTQALERPLFVSDRRPRSFVMDDVGDGSIRGVRLNGVLMTPELNVATLTTERGQSVRLHLGGEPKFGWQLLSLQPRSAIVTGPSGTINLELQVFSEGRKILQEEHQSQDIDIPASSAPMPSIPG